MEYWNYQFDRSIQERDDASYALALQMQMEMEQQRIENERINLINEAEDEDFAKVLQNHYEEEERNERKRRQEEENIVECGCCCTPLPFQEMAQCPEGHLICKRCIIMSIEAALGEGRVRTECPNINCKRCISNSELERILPQSVMKRLDETEAFNALNSVNIRGLRTCWRCGLKTIDESNTNPYICPQCSEKTCISCNKKYHPGRTCEQADMDPNRIVELKMSEAVVRSCPRCNTQFVKDEGCNHMTCPRCRTEFCYLCGQVIPNGKVRKHYQKCKQFIDNAKYNQEHIEMARRQALNDMQLPF
ncbi:hypothetical protein M9Y10_013951 [Tritrichomonas musculus]|uniref:RING-type domain-containing protein n=1 Tax=Tritrichomonas musculus TaxID=1915356 RepID=A0ABR2KZ45_9EUKA